MNNLYFIIKSKGTNEVIWSYNTFNCQKEIAGDEIITGDIKNNKYLNKIHNDLKDYIFELKAKG